MTSPPLACSLDLMRHTLHFCAGNHSPGGGEQLRPALVPALPGRLPALYCRLPRAVELAGKPGQGGCWYALPLRGLGRASFAGQIVQQRCPFARHGCRQTRQRLPHDVGMLAAHQRPTRAVLTMPSRLAISCLAGAADCGGRRRCAVHAGPPGHAALGGQSASVDAGHRVSHR